MNKDIIIALVASIACVFVLMFETMSLSQDNKMLRQEIQTGAHCVSTCNEIWEDYAC